MKRNETDAGLVVGARVRLSALGMERLRTLGPDASGRIVGVSRTGTALRVLFKGRKSTIALHQSYIELDDGAAE